MMRIGRLTALWHLRRIWMHFKRKRNAPIHGHSFLFKGFMQFFFKSRMFPKKVFSDLENILFSSLSLTSSSVHSRSRLGEVLVIRLSWQYLDPDLQRYSTAHQYQKTKNQYLIDYGTQSKSVPFLFTRLLPWHIRRFFSSGTLQLRKKRT